MKNVLIPAAIIALVAGSIVFAVMKPNSTPETKTVQTPAIEFDYSILPTVGDKNAKVKLVEFGDYKCPSCQDFVLDVKPQLMKDFVETGKVSFSYIDMAFVGPDSYIAAMVGRAIYHQNEEEFWKYYDYIYQNQGSPRDQWATTDYLLQVTKDLNLNIDFDELTIDVIEESYGHEVTASHEFADKNGVTSTPSLFVNGVRIADAKNYEVVSAAIERALVDVK
ncbi:Disulfide bond formation protein D precursor [compost metagenome]